MSSFFTSQCKYDPVSLMWTCFYLLCCTWYLRKGRRKSYSLSAWWEGFRPTLRSPLAIPKNWSRVPFSAHNPPHKNIEYMPTKHSFCNLDNEESIIHCYKTQICELWINLMLNISIAKCWVSWSLICGHKWTNQIISHYGIFT